MPKRGGAIYSIDVIVRILQALEENGPMKRTNLAIKCSLNYAILLRYLKLLNSLSWVSITFESDKLNVLLTVAGMSVKHKLLPFAGNENTSKIKQNPDPIAITTRINS